MNPPEQPSHRGWRIFWILIILFMVAVPTGLLWNILRPALHKDVINHYAAIYKMDPLLIMALVKVESHFDEEATSHRGAIGLMQLMPATAREMAERTGMGKNLDEKDLSDPDVNLRLGIHYLSMLREEFKGDTVTMLAAYNAGPANVRAWLKNGPLTLDNIPFPETRQFVKNNFETYKHLKKFQKAKNVFHS